MNYQTKFISIEKYFELLNKNENELKPEEIAKMESLRNHIKLSKEYKKYLSGAALDVLKKYNTKIIDLSTKENRTPQEEQVLQEYQTSFQNNENTLEQEGPVLKRSKAGYIDATIILTILLNIGFIIAVTIIGG